MAIARRRSNANAPNPSQMGRYAEPKGATASIHRIGANPVDHDRRHMDRDEHQGEEREIAMDPLDHEPRGAPGRPPGDARDTQHDDRCQQQERDGTASPSQVPERS